MNSGKRKRVTKSSKRVPVRATTSFTVTEVQSSTEDNQTSQSEQDVAPTYNLPSTANDTQTCSPDESEQEVDTKLHQMSFQSKECDSSSSSDESDLEVNKTYDDNDTEIFSSLEKTFIETKIPVSEDYGMSSSSSETSNIKKSKLDTSEISPDLNESTLSLDLKSKVIFEQESPNDFKMHLEPNTVIYFHGKISIKILSGHVQVLGWDMYEGDERQIFSPKGSSFLGIETFSQSSDVELKPLDSHVASSLGALLPGQLFNARKETTNVLPSARVKIQAERFLDCRFMKKSPDAKVIVIPEEWRDTLRNISQAVGFYENTRAVLCGGKGVGKSTFLRILTNSLLSKQEAGSRGVLVLDFDPGQAEFTAPGCLAAVLVQQPLLGPGYTQQLTPQKMMFLGHVDVSQVCKAYKASVKALINYCLQHHKNVPWVVNTMGFNTGLGVELLKEILQLVSSENHAHIVDIQSTDQRRNYSSQLWAQQLLSSLVYYQISSATDIPGSRHAQQIITQGFPPKQLREISLLAYLSPALSTPHFSLLATEPYMIPVDSLILGVIHKKVDPWCILRAVLGNLVGLCHANSKVRYQALRPSSRKGPGFLPRPEALPCFGYGVVCGIDFDSGLLYLQTPEPWERLAQVNCLLLGAIELPNLLRTPEDVSGPVPYVCCGKSHSTNAPVRRFYRPASSFTPSTPRR